MTDAQPASVHDTNDSKQNCREGNAAQHCKLGLFKNSARLKSYIHHTSTAHHCRSGVFQGSDSAGDENVVNGK